MVMLVYGGLLTFRLPDCPAVAQLTTKIKHLPSVLHKKDKHSLKGLQAMVQRRKRLLKYLWRSDWVSYCLVLSKLGLRDTPDYKQEYKKHYKN
ncbi:uncharacterized protein LOC133708486 [Rosa rugosa]|uniref:uncharacterized protein LOC133708486 n=1 Tax=Rosa rugosa TaxID=74645 RepID=UPI002B409F35|nr:uncharacterized protein LOC133708486 [Rosa rugosa]